VTAETTNEERAPSRASDDPLLRQMRHELSDLDRAVVDLFNRRLDLVRRIRTRKAALGMPFLDPEREEWMLRYLERANRGTLSRPGLAELHGAMLAVTKRELAGR
jgi:chorismate mutase / prephenate dehydratase